MRLGLITELKNGRSCNEHEVHLVFFGRIKIALARMSWSHHVSGQEDFVKPHRKQTVTQNEGKHFKLPRLLSKVLCSVHPGSAESD